MKVLLFLLIGLPAAIIMIALAVANRHGVVVSLDPTTTVGGVPEPAVAATLPVWVLLFGVLVLGVVIGGLAAWSSQHRYRSEARSKRREAKHWHRQADEEHERAERLRREEKMAEREAAREAANDDTPQIRRRPLPALTGPGR